jgi:hypothetical protein
MALSKTVLVDKLEILEMGQVQVRTATLISEDGTELSRSFHRHVLNPGDDTSGELQRVQDVTAATWTAQVVTDWDALVAARAADTP